MSDIAKVSTCLERDRATLVSIDKSIVTFICKCGTQYNKKIGAICTTTGAFCKWCSQKNTAIKRIQKRIDINNSLLRPAGLV